MKKILLILTFIVACNIAIPCKANPLLSSKHNLVPIFLIGATCCIIGTYYLYAFLITIYKKNFSCYGTHNSNTIEGNNIKDQKSIPINNNIENEKSISINNNTHSIIVTGSGTLHFIKSKHGFRGYSQLWIRTDRITLDSLEVTHNNNMCSIGPKKNATLNPTIPIEYELMLTEPLIKSLESLTISGSLSANLGILELSNKKTFNLNSSGQSLITNGTFHNIDSLNITCSDNSKIKNLKESANNATINLNKTAECILDSFTINNIANVTTRGESIAIIKTKQLSCDASDKSEIYYKGETIILNQTISHSARISQF